MFGVEELRLSNLLALIHHTYYGPCTFIALKRKCARVIHPFHYHTSTISLHSDLQKHVVELDGPKPFRDP